MSDRDHWGLRGPVRAADIERGWEQNGDHSIVEFRPDGSISRHWHRNPDGSEVTNTHTHDSGGRLTSVQFESSSSPATFRLYEYDALGRPARHSSRDSSGHDRTFETYSYDTSGRKTKTHFVDLAAQRPNTNYGWGVEGSNAIYSAHNAAKLTTLYNEADCPTELLFHDDAGTLLCRVDFLCDAAGNLIEESQMLLKPPFPDMEEKLPPEQTEVFRNLISAPFSRRLHRYNQQGHRIETITSMFGSIGTGRETLAYNEHGDPVAQTTEEESRERGFDEAGQPIDRPGHQSRSEARFLYEYDSHGNWISKITEVRSGDNSDFVVTSTERRALTYFDPI